MENIEWFLKPKLSKKRKEEFSSKIEELVEQKYQLRSLPCDSFYKWAKDKVDELYKFGNSTASLLLQKQYSDEIRAIEKTLEIYEAHIKERGKI